VDETNLQLASTDGFIRNKSEFAYVNIWNNCFLKSRVDTRFLHDDLSVEEEAVQPSWKSDLVLEIQLSVRVTVKVCMLLL